MQHIESDTMFLQIDWLSEIHISSCWFLCASVIKAAFLLLPLRRAHTHCFASFASLSHTYRHTRRQIEREIVRESDRERDSERERESLQMISGLQSIQQVLALLTPLPVSTQKHSGVQSNAHSLCCFCGLIYRGDPRGLVHQHDWLIRKFGS